MNHLVLDLSNPDIAKALKGCDSGDHVEFTVGGTLAVNGKAATVNLDSVKYTSMTDDNDEAAEGDTKPEPAAKASKSPKPKMAAAVSSYAPGQD